MERINTLIEMLKQNGNDSFLEHALALEYIKINDDQKARGLFEKLLERDPGYVGSYYHLGKLLERSFTASEAIAVYKKGMVMAKNANEMRSFHELQAALEELENE